MIAQVFDKEQAASREHFGKTAKTGKLAVLCGLCYNQIPMMRRRNAYGEICPQRKDEQESAEGAEPKAPEDVGFQSCYQNR